MVVILLVLQHLHLVVEVLAHQQMRHPVVQDHLVEI
jgi:hypothetical protein